MSVATMLARSGHVITIKRSTTGKDTMGGKVAAWAVVEALIPAWVQPASSETVMRYERRGLTITNAVYIGGGVEVLEKDRVEFGTEIHTVIGVEDQAGLDRCIAIITRLEK